MANKKTNYFSHDSNARNDEKVVRLRMRHGAAGYGVYFMLIERLREEADYASIADYEMIAYDLRIDTRLVQSVVEDFGLFVVEDGRFFSPSFNRRMEIKDKKSQTRSEAGKRGNSKRWQGDAKPVVANGAKHIANATENADFATEGTIPPNVGETEIIAKSPETVANATEIVANVSQMRPNSIASKVKESKINKKKSPNGDKEKDADAPFHAPQPRARDVFIKPTEEEVDAYIREYAENKGLPLSFTAQAWLSHYECCGWLVGKDKKMKDWKASVRYWFSQRHNYDANNRTNYQSQPTRQEQRRLEQQQRAAGAAALVADLLANGKPPA